MFKKFWRKPFDQLHSHMYQMVFAQKKILLDNNLLFVKEQGVSKEKYCDHDIIVSLTTYGRRRIHSVYLTIESIMEQTIKPNRIILWLDDSFKDKILPNSLNLLCKRGLEIAFCKDVRSYTKLLPALCKFPDDAIITVDDDVLYDVNMIENLITPYLSDSNQIYCNRAHRMIKSNDGKLIPYNQWQNSIEETGTNVLNFATGVGGVLYPPHSLDNEVFNEDVYLDICKYADDVWFKAMALKKGTPVCRVETYHINGADYLLDEDVQDMALMNRNVFGESLNDKQIEAVFTKYNLYNLL